ncbi:MAG: OmpA family protein [Bacteroidota bacterium]
MLNKILLNIFFLILIPFYFFSQEETEGQTKKFCQEIDNKSALKLYEKAKDKKQYKKPERLEFLRKCLDAEPDFAEANLAMGNEIVVTSKLNNKSFAPAVPYFQKAINVCPQIHSEPYYFIGFNYYEEVKNDSAIKYLEKFIKFRDEDEKKFSKDYEGEIYQAREMIKYAKKEGELKKKIVPFDPKVVRGVSTPRDEYLAYISPDNKLCFFTRKVPVESKSVVYQSDKEKEAFMVAQSDKAGNFNAGELMPYPFNQTDDGQGGCSISIDNKRLYFSMTRNEGGAQQNCDIYVSENINDEWQPIKKISANVNHPIFWDSQPSVSADGNTIFFASDRPGGYGGIDIYITQRDVITGEWSIPKNAGPKINTRGDEKTPFIHSDSKTLYFSSNGHFGFGGYDLFYCRKNENNQWLDPENIGTPINTEADDTGFFVSSNGKTAYFFSYDEGKLRGKGVGKTDLYSFELYKEARPEEIVFFSGEVKDKFGNVVEGGRVEITNTVTKEKTNAILDSSSGKFTVALNVSSKEDILITVKKNNYSFSSKIISPKDIIESLLSVDNQDQTKLTMDINEASQGSSFIINNIQYNTNSSDLKKESFIVLESFVEFLKENPSINIEVQGHTDNVGSAVSNQALSANRAYSIKSLLEEKGIDGKRLTAKGYGSSKPIADNKTEEGRAKNRRTEFLITKK